MRAQVDLVDPFEREHPGRYEAEHTRRVVFSRWAGSFDSGNPQWLNAAVTS